MSIIDECNDRVTPEELLRRVRKWLTVPSSDGTEHTAWPELVAQIDITLQGSNNTATAMRDRCVEKLTELIDAEQKKHPSAHVAVRRMTLHDAITAIQALTLEGEQEKSSE